MFRTLTALLAVAGIAIGAAAPKPAKADDLDTLVGILAGATALAIIADAVTDNRVYVAPRYVAPRVYVAPRYVAPRIYVAPRYVLPPVYVAPRYVAPRYVAPRYVYRPVPVVRRPVAIDRRTVVHRAPVERRVIRRSLDDRDHYYDRDRRRNVVRPGEYDASRYRFRPDRPADRVERVRDRYQGR